MAPFRRLKEHELQELFDEELIAYANEARKAGEHDCWLLAMQMLVWGFIGRVNTWIRRKVDEDDAEDLIQEVFERALTSLARETARFAGSTSGEFGAWLRRITQFVIADYYKAREGKPPVDSLSRGNGDEDEYGPEPSEEDHTAQVVNQDVVDQAFGELSDLHKRVIRLVGDVQFGFRGLSPQEAAEMISAGDGREEPHPMTDVNAYQIKSRFKKRLRELNDDADQAGGPNG